jgi:hypothetical protein
MRMNTISVVGFALAVMPILSVSALSAYPASSTEARSGSFTQVADACPAGQYWEEAGYVADGKWRPAHCANDRGHQ